MRMQPLTSPTGLITTNLSLPKLSVLPSLSVTPAAALPSAANGAAPVLFRSKGTGAEVKTAAPSRLVLPAPPGSAAAPANPGLRQGLSKSVAGVRKAKGVQAKGGFLNRIFDGIRNLADAAFAVDTERTRPPDWYEDRRIDAAFRRLMESPIGLDMYTYIYENYGDSMEIKVDDSRGADYDARLVYERGIPVIQLTESLVDNESSEMIAAYVARELTELYMRDFPESAERNYMAFSNMGRVFAELTDSGRSRYGYWWDTGKDKHSGEAYVMERFYGSWKEAVTDNYNYGKRIQDSPFFKYLKEWGGDNIGRDSKLTLWQLYRRGRITGRKYREMRDYINQFVDTEQSWLNDTGRR